MDVGDSFSIRCPFCQAAHLANVHLRRASATCPACHKEFPFSAMSPSDICRVRAGQMGYRFVDLDSMEIPAAVLEAVPEAIARHDKVVPVAIDGDTLSIAVSDPHATGGLDRLRFALNRPVVMVMATEEGIVGAIDRHYGNSDRAAREHAADETAQSVIEFVEVPAAVDGHSAHDATAPESPAVTDTVQRMLSEAFRVGASRLLIMPVQDQVKVAYRIRDVVCQRENLPPGMLHSVLVRLMTMANLNGVIKVTLGGKEWRLLATFKPTKDGLSLLMEIPLDQSLVVACKARAARLGYRFINLDETEVPADVLAMVPVVVAREYQILPIAMDGDTLEVVMGDPQVPDILDTLRFILNRPIHAAMAPAGAILEAIDRHYGVADPAAADLLLWELAQQSEAEPAAGKATADRLRRQLEAVPRCLAAPVLDHLRTVVRDAMIELFERVRGSAQLCKQDAVTGDIEVVFPQCHLMPLMTLDARRYLEHKVWVLREAILARLENFLERDALARGVAMAYAQYLACCQLAEGQQVSINPATARDAWINFLYCFVLQSFPTIDSNGALLAFVTEHLKAVASKATSLLDDPSMVADPKLARQWIGRMASQTITDEAIDCHSGPIIQQVKLLIAEAFHFKASAILLLPWEDRIEVAYRVQNAVFARDSLPLRLLYPMLARLTVLAKPTGELSLATGKKNRTLLVTFQPTTYGLAVLLEISPDAAMIEACKDRAAEHGYEFVSLEEVEVPAAILDLVPKAIAWKKVVLPLAVRAGALEVVVANPPGPRRLDELKLAFNCPISIAMAPEDEILAALHRHYHPKAVPPAVSSVAISMLAGRSKAG